jgi:hypothetical protein
LAAFLTGIDGIKQHLIDQGETVLWDGRGLQLVARPRGHVGRLMLFEPRPGQVRAVLMLPFDVAASELGAFTQRMATVNAKIGLGTFQLREHDGSYAAVFVVYAWYNHDGSISTEVVDRVVETARVTTDHFLLELFPDVGEG